MSSPLRCTRCGNLLQFRGFIRVGYDEQGEPIGRAAYLCLSNLPNSKGITIEPDNIPEYGGKDFILKAPTSGAIACDPGEKFLFFSDMSPVRNIIWLERPEERWLRQSPGGSNAPSATATRSSAGRTRRPRSNAPVVT